MMNNNPTIFVVDSDLEVQASLSDLMRSAHLGVETFASAESFLDSYESGRPGCVVVDLLMPGMDGLQLTKELRNHGEAIPVIIHTNPNDTETVVRAMQSGVHDFLDKPVEPPRLLASVQDAIQQDRRRREDHLVTLSPRLRQTLEQLMLGDSEKQVATKLGLSRYTIHDYVKTIYKHFNVRSRGELLAKCFAAHENRFRSA